MDVRSSKWQVQEIKYVQIVMKVCTRENISVLIDDAINRCVINSYTVINSYRQFAFPSILNRYYATDGYKCIEISHTSVR